MTDAQNRPEWLVKALEKREGEPNKGDMPAYRLLAVRAIELLTESLESQGVELQMGAELEFGVAGKDIEFSLFDQKQAKDFKPQFDRLSNDPLKISKQGSLRESPRLSRIYIDGNSHEAVFTHLTDSDSNHFIELAEQIENFKYAIVNDPNLNEGKKISFNANSKFYGEQGLHLTIDIPNEELQSLYSASYHSMAGLTFLSFSNENQLGREKNNGVFKPMDNAVQFKAFCSDNDAYLGILSVLIQRYLVTNPKLNYEIMERDDDLHGTIEATGNDIGYIREAFESSEVINIVLNSLEVGLGDDFKQAVLDAVKKDPNALVWGADRYEDKELQAQLKKEQTSGYIEKHRKEDIGTHEEGYFR